MKISVILTSYNHEKFLAESIESVLNQTYRNFEFIIVDDCSTDASWHIIEMYKERYPDIITLQHEYNWGGGTVADVVRNYATGDYIAIHHSDDLWEPDKLHKQVDIFKEHSEYAAVFTNADAIDDAGNPYEDENGFYYNLFAVENRSRFKWLNYFFFHGNCLCHPSILVKKSVYEDDGFFRKGLKQIPDFVKWIQICKKHDIYIIPEVLVKFRVHASGQNTSGMRADTQIRSTVELFLMLQEYLDIRNKEEFLSIFPEAKKYCIGNYFSTEYVLGRICTEEGMPSYTRLFGVEQLYKVLNDSTQTELLQKEASYYAKDFAQANGKYDIFGLLPREFEQVRSIYYDCGNGYNAGQIVKENYTFNQELAFQMQASIVTDSALKITRLRFDPAEGVFLRCKIEHIIVNGEELEYAAENALRQANGEDVFINLDPIYDVKLSPQLMEQNKLVIEIKGKMSRLTDAEIGNIVMEFMYCQRDRIAEYADKLKKEEEKFQLSVLQKEELIEKEKSLEISYQMLSNELSKVSEARNNLEADYAITSQELSKVSEEKRHIEEDYKLISCKLEKISEDKKRIEEDSAIMSEELGQIKNQRWYKAWEKIQGIKERWRRSE